jgi:hypothetical protein
VLYSQQYYQNHKFETILWHNGINEIGGTIGRAGFLSDKYRMYVKLMIKLYSLATGEKAAH